MSMRDLSCACVRVRVYVRVRGCMRGVLQRVYIGADESALRSFLAVAHVQRRLPGRAAIINRTRHKPCM